jgi:glyceraldehyde-3-phosphate dehydrogenase (NADP+)
VGGFSYAGQSCISVQRIFVHEAVADAFREQLLAGLKNLKVGDPLDTTTDIGPMVDEANARRVQRWVDEAVSMGGSLLAGGKANGAWFEPTVLENVPATANVCSNEAFAPLVVLATFDDFESAIAQVNDSEFGLQTGVFTNDLTHAWQAFNDLEVGGVVMNDISSYRVDHMPYGGVKDSGLGREGLRWSIEDMTELRIMVLASPQ